MAAMATGSSDVVGVDLRDLRCGGAWEVPETQRRSRELLEREGCAVMTEVVGEDALVEARRALEPALFRIAESLQEDQHLSEALKEEFGLVRAPPVGDGKTNVHFDEHESEEHAAMERLAESGRFAEVCSSYCGRDLTLYESGASITTPGGEGMEWHRDGQEGECTVLVSLRDVEGDQGELGVIPKSHAGAVADKAEDEEVAAGGEAERAAVWYAYEAGRPMVIDARTQHSVRDNTSETTRCILWYIYN